YLLGWIETFTPPATATSQPPRCRLWQARWIAVNDDEHIAAIAMLRPWQVHTYAPRLPIEAGLPGSASDWPRACACAPYNWYSSYITPTNTPTLPSSPCSLYRPRLSRV